MCFHAALASRRRVVHIDNVGSLCFFSVLAPLVDLSKNRNKNMDTPHTCSSGIVWTKEDGQSSQSDLGVGELRPPSNIYARVNCFGEIFFFAILIQTEENTEKINFFFFFFFFYCNTQVHSFW